MGAAVIEAALVNLNNNSNWNSKITSVHLLGAAINNQLIANNTVLGNATEHIVDKFYNFYNPEDDALKYNQGFEHHDPLGMVGAPEGTFIRIIMIQTLQMKYPLYLMQMGTVTWTALKTSIP